jgi:short-subunit dehydrogenase
VRLKPLSRQVVVITGATSGIGLATARRAAEHGASLFLIARSGEALEKLAHELTAQGVRAAFQAADVGVESELRAAADACVKAFGGFDTWINDAGSFIVGPIRETTLEDHKKLFETNYFGVVHGSLIAAEHLRSRGGAIINLGCMLSDTPVPLQGAVAASKHAVKGFTEALRMELIREGAPVSVTLIKPSSVDTPSKDHARNLTDTAVRAPSPVYAASLVADAVLYCAEHPVRQMTVGGAGRAVSVLHKLFPGLAEPAYARLFPLLQRDRGAPRATHDSLYEPGEDYLRETAEYGRVRETSLFTRMQMRPFATVGVALGIGAALGLVGLVRSMRRKHKGREPMARQGEAAHTVHHLRVAPSVGAATGFLAMAAVAGAAFWAYRRWDHENRRLHLDEFSRRAEGYGDPYGDRRSFNLLKPRRPQRRRRDDEVVQDYADTYGDTRP